jgi:CBS-domain-containing membrane protein
MKMMDVMTRNVKTCRIGDNLHQAAQVMWENDCGIVPVLDESDRVVGMLTDRDICMAAYTRGEALWAIAVSHAMSKQVHGVRTDDSIETAETIMRRAQVRRVPVLDADGRVLGIVSMNDLARRSEAAAGRKSDGLSSASIVRTLASICESNAETHRLREATKTGAKQAAGTTNGHAKRTAKPRTAASTQAPAARR